MQFLESYKTEFRSAYEGELIGSLLYGQHAPTVGDSAASRAFAGIAAVERVTYEALASVAARYAITPRQKHVQAVVERRLIEMSRTPWQDFLQKAQKEWPDIVLLYQELQRSAPTEDQAALERLVAHEVTLVGFVNSLAAGTPVDLALQPLHDFCTETEGLAGQRYQVSLDPYLCAT